MNISMESLLSNLLYCNNMPGPYSDLFFNLPLIPSLYDAFVIYNTLSLDQIVLCLSELEDLADSELKRIRRSMCCAEQLAAFLFVTSFNREF